MDTVMPVTEDDGVGKLTVLASDYWPGLSDSQWLNDHASAQALAFAVRRLMRSPWGWSSQRVAARRLS
jgi:hypothetical protein